MVLIPDYIDYLYNINGTKKTLIDNYIMFKDNYVHRSAIIDWDNIIIGKDNVFGPMSVIGDLAQHKYYRTPVSIMLN